MNELEITKVKTKKSNSQLNVVKKIRKKQLKSLQLENRVVEVEKHQTVELKLGNIVVETEKQTDSLQLKNETKRIRIFPKEYDSPQLENTIVGVENSSSEEERLENTIIEIEKNLLNDVQLNNAIVEVEKSLSNAPQLENTIVGVEKSSFDRISLNSVVPIVPSSKYYRIVKDIPFGASRLKFNGRNIGQTLREVENSLKIKPILKEIKTDESSDVKKIIQVGMDISFNCGILLDASSYSFFNTNSSADNLVIEGELIIETLDGMIEITIYKCSLELSYDFQFKQDKENRCEIKGRALEHIPKKIKIEFKGGENGDF